MAGRRSLQSSSISQLTSQPETIPSCYRRSRHAEFQPLSGRHDQRLRSPEIRGSHRAAFWPAVPATQVRSGSFQSDCEIVHTQTREGNASLSEMRAYAWRPVLHVVVERQEAMMSIPDSSDVARLQAIYAKLARIAAQMNDPCVHRSAIPIRTAVIRWAETTLALTWSA
jgi:hypothetical protein